MKMSKGSLTTLLLDYAAGAWIELGASVWNRRRVQQCIDPEALILLTGSLGDSDPRLRDESLDWCPRFRELLSRSRTAALLKNWPEAPAWSSYAARLSGATGEPWPGAGSSQGERVVGRNRLLLPRHMGLLGLRLRAAFGTTARAEVLRILLMHPERALRIAEITEDVGHTKRNVAEAVVSLGRAGIVSFRSSAGADLYSLEHRDEIVAVFGPLPLDRTSFLAACRAAWRLASGLDRIADLPSSARSVEARVVLRDASPDLRRIGQRWDVPRAGADAWSAIVDRTSSWMGGLSRASPSRTRSYR